MAARTNAANLLLATSKMSSRRPTSIAELSSEVNTWRTVAVLFWTTIFNGFLISVTILYTQGVSVWFFVSLCAALISQASVAWLHCATLEVSPLAPLSLTAARRLASWVGLWICSAAVFVFFCTALTSFYEGDHLGLGLLTPCKETRAVDLTVRNVYCLHEPAFVQYLAGSCIAGLLVLQHWKSRGYLLSFPDLQQVRWFRVKMGLGRVMRSGISLVFWAEIVFYIGYCLWGTWASAWAASLTSGVLQRPVYVYPSFWSEDSGYFPYCGVFAGAGLLSAMSWYFSALVTRITFTQSLSFDPEATGNHRLLTAGLKMKNDSYIRYLAFLDLCTLSEVDRDRRKLLFNDISDEAALIGAIQECCHVIDTFTIDLQSATLAQLDESDKKKSQVDRIKKAFMARLGRSSTPAALFDSRQVVAWAAFALSNLISHSMREDRYGLVQSNNTVPTSLNSLVSCLVTVKQHEQATEQYLRARGIDAVPSTTASLAEGLATAVYKITGTFHKYMQEYQFPEALVPTLEAFVSFQV